MSSSGSVLMLMDDVVFRKVLPEQIQMAIAAQSTPEDAPRQARCVPRRSPFSGSGRVGAMAKAMKAMKAKAISERTGKPKRLR